MMVNSVKGANISETWLKATDFILENGNKHQGLSREVLNLISVVQNPLDISGNIHDLFLRHIGSRWVAKGANCIFPSATSHRKAISWSRDYWGRLTKYRGKVDQLDFIVQRLKSKPHSKQLVCVTFDPEIDMRPDRPFNPSMPCLVTLDVKLRNGKINLFAMFRSHDFGRKAYGNFIGLGKLLNWLCRNTGYDVGEVMCYSASAHVRARELHCVKAILEDYQESESTSIEKVFQTRTLEAYTVSSQEFYMNSDLQIFAGKELFREHSKRPRRKLGEQTRLTCHEAT